MTKTARQDVQHEIERMEDANAEQIAEDLELYSWGLWSRARGDRLGYAKPVAAFSAKGTWEPDLRRHIHMISDDKALRIDKAVAQLRGPQQIIIKAIYAEWIPWRRLPDVLGVSANTIRKYQHQGLGALEVLLRGDECQH
jgi:DNA-directed RNA polymerase specialized sigma24 family protein